MKFLKFWFPVIGWMGFIYHFSAQSKVQVSEVFFIQFVIFKTLHVIEYAILYVLLYRALRNTTSTKANDNRWNAFLYAIVYAMTDEIHQMFIPTREGRIRDIFIDVIGISLAALYIWKLLPTAPKRLKIWVGKLEII